MKSLVHGREKLNRLGGRMLKAIMRPFLTHDSGIIIVVTCLCERFYILVQNDNKNGTKKLLIFSL